MAITRDWDGGSYDRISAPMLAMGLEVLARLDLRGDEVVLDAGCGSGRVTEALLDRLPRGRVIAVDGSASMIAAARDRLGERGNVELVHADLMDLDLGGTRCDAILSTATFHWVPDHPRLFMALRRAMKPGARLVAQCGGFGNIDRVHAAAADVARRPQFAPWFEGWTGPWNFRDADGMTADLEATGFVDVACRLVPRDVVPDDPEEWFRTIVLGSHIERLPEDLRDPFVRAVVQVMPAPVTVDYVRLDIAASAPG